MPIGGRWETVRETECSVGNRMRLTRLVKFDSLRDMTKKKTKDTYSLYEAKTQLSAIVRQVREGRTVTVTLHGEPAVEIRPVPRTAVSVEEHFHDLEARGILQRSTTKRPKIKRGKHIPGAYARFMASRD